MISPSSEIVSDRPLTALSSTNFLEASVMPCRILSDKSSSSDLLLFICLALSLDCIPNIMILDHVFSEPRCNTIGIHEFFTVKHFRQDRETGSRLTGPAMFSSTEWFGQYSNSRSVITTLSSPALIFLSTNRVETRRIQFFFSP